MAKTLLKLKQVQATEDFNFGGFILSNLGAPVAANDVTRKAYVDSEVSKVAGAMTYKGIWDATQNLPVLPVAAADNKGHYYVVAVAGTTVIDGVADWEQRDWVVSNGAAWEKIDNTDKVVSVFGRSGPILAQAGDYAAEQVTFTPAGSLQATDVQGALAEVDGDVTALTGRVTTAEADIDALEGRVTNAEADATALEARVTATEGEIDTLQAADSALTDRVTAVEGALPTKLNAALAAGRIFVGNADGTAVAAKFVVREAAVANGGFTSFALAATPVVGTEQVYINGLLVDVVDDYTLDGVNILPVAALAATDKVRVTYITLA
jgi:uncharacterized coiled-coil protein SlyX